MFLKVERKGETSTWNGKMKKNGNKLTLNSSSNVISNSRFRSHFTQFSRSSCFYPAPRFPLLVTSETGTEK